MCVFTGYQTISGPETYPLVTYKGLRESLESGDVVTWVGRDPLGRIIRAFAPGGSHTSWILRLPQHEDLVMLVEAVGRGLVPTRASRRFSNYNGDILIHRLNCTKEQRRGIEAMSLRLLVSDIKYDTPSLLKNVRRRVALSMKRGFCSESGAYVLANNGVIEPLTLAPTPGEFAAMLPPPVRLVPYTCDGEAD